MQQITATTISETNMGGINIMKKGDKVWTITPIWVDGRTRSGMAGVVIDVDGDYIMVRLCGLKHRVAQFYPEEIEKRNE